MQRKAEWDFHKFVRECTVAEGKKDQEHIANMSEATKVIFKKLFTNYSLKTIMQIGKKYRNA